MIKKNFIRRIDIFPNILWVTPEVNFARRGRADSHSGGRGWYRLTEKRMHRLIRALEENDKLYKTYVDDNIVLSIHASKRVKEE